MSLSAANSQILQVYVQDSDTDDTRCVLLSMYLYWPSSVTPLAMANINTCSATLTEYRLSQVLRPSVELWRSDFHACELASTSQFFMQTIPTTIDGITEVKS